MAYPHRPEECEHRLLTKWLSGLRQLLTPPAPFVMNPAERLDAPLGKWNLYIGGAGSAVPGFVNLDIVPWRGVDVVADVQQLPFPDEVFTRVECDAVLEHVHDPQRSVRELIRVLVVGGIVHIVTPFCHPFHEHPNDFWRFSIDGLRRLGPELEELHAGWRTGPTATLLVIVLEYVKLLFPLRAWRILAHGTLGWVLFPLRYLDLLFFRNPQCGRIGNHCFLWLRKRDACRSEDG